MKILRLSLVLLLTTLAARGDLTLVQELRQTGRAESGQVTMKIKGTLIRSDVNPDMSVIINTTTGETTSLMHQQKVAMKIPGSVIQAAQAQAAAQMGKDTPQPKPTGLTDEINGFACEQYTFVHDGRPMEIWVTKDLKNAADIFAQLAKLAPQMNPMGNTFQNTLIDGFPVKTVADMGNGEKFSMTLVSVSEAGLPDSDFKAPKDYKPVEMPKIPGQ
ncbi:MAG: hypothetical protein Fur0032_03470 [Terrimicrobiaceae bacterium]